MEHENTLETVGPERIGDASFYADVGERAVAIVAEEMIGLADESERAAEDGNATELAGIGRTPSSGG